MPKMKTHTAFNPSVTGQQFKADVLAATIMRSQAVSDLAVLTTQTQHLTPIWLPQGTVCTGARFFSSSTGANTPTNWWFALYTNVAAPVLLAATADQTTTAWAADTDKAVAFAAPYTITTEGIYLLSIMMKATAVVTLAGVAVDAVNILENNNGDYDGSLTTAPPDPATTIQSADVNIPLAEIY